MIKRLKTSLGMVAGLAALSLGGAAIAGAATGTAPVKHATPEVTQTVDTDHAQVQSGDQTAPDTSSASATSATSETSGETGASDGPGGHADNGNANTQSGDQSASDTSGATSETSSPETGAASDGPGGPDQQGQH